MTGVVNPDEVVTAPILAISYSVEGSYRGNPVTTTATELCRYKNTGAAAGSDPIYRIFEGVTFARAGRSTVFKMLTGYYSPAINSRAVCIFGSGRRVITESMVEVNNVELLKVGD